MPPPRDRLRIVASFLYSQAREELRHQGEAQADLHDAKEEWREWRAQAVGKLEAASHAGTTQVRVNRRVIDATPKR